MTDDERPRYPATGLTSTHGRCRSALFRGTRRDCRRQRMGDHDARPDQAERAPPAPRQYRPLRSAAAITRPQPLGRLGKTERARSKAGSRHAPGTKPVRVRRRRPPRCLLVIYLYREDRRPVRRHPGGLGRRRAPPSRCVYRLSMSVTGTDERRGPPKWPHRIAQPLSRSVKRSCCSGRSDREA